MRPRLLLLLRSGALAGFRASAYYHFIHYLNGAAMSRRSSTWRRCPTRPLRFSFPKMARQLTPATDTFNSVLSQLRQATAAWNGVGRPTSGWLLAAWRICRPRRIRRAAMWFSKTCHPDCSVMADLRLSLLRSQRRMRGFRSD